MPRRWRGALLETWRQHIATARPKAGVDAYLRDPVAALEGSGGDLGKAAVAARLVDKLGERHMFEARLAELGGKDLDAKGGYEAIRLGAYVNEQVDRDSQGPIGIVTIAGEIVDGKAGAGSAGGETIARAIEKGLSDDRLKALVVRVDSPGGSAIASERIRQALLQAQGEENPGGRLDGQCRRVGRILGGDRGRPHLRRAVDHHRIDRGVRRAAELPGQPGETRRRRGRGEDHAAVGRARPAGGPLARGRSR